MPHDNSFVNIDPPMQSSVVYILIVFIYSTVFNHADSFNLSVAQNSHWVVLFSASMNFVSHVSCWPRFINSFNCRSNLCLTFNLKSSVLLIVSYFKLFESNLTLYDLALTVKKKLWNENTNVWPTHVCDYLFILINVCAAYQLCRICSFQRE